MDLIFEFFAELLFEGCVQIAESRRINKVIRYAAILLITAVLLGLLLLFALLCIGAEGVILKLICIALTLLMAVLIVRFYRRLFQPNNKEEE